MPSLADRVHRELRSRLLRGEFHLGDRLAEVRIAELLGVSRTPVREALRRLEAEELVTATAGGGVRPAVPDLERIADFYDVRVGLETLSVDRACDPEADRTALAALRQRWCDLAGRTDDLEGPDFIYVEEAFHVDLARCGANQALASILEDVNRHIRIVRVQDFFIPGRVADTIAEHTAIVTAVLDGSRDEAKTLMATHVSTSASHVRERALSVIARMSAAPDTLDRV